MMTRDDLGAIVTLHRGSSFDPSITTLIDNGCFSQPDSFTVEAYRRLTSDYPTAIFATVPDVVADWDGTLQRWRSFPKNDWPVPLAIVLQDGATVSTIPWHEIGAVFVGGSTEWKLGSDARAIVAAANERGIWAHMGRVNGRRRLLYAEWIGCDSADGTHLAFGPDQKLPELLGWLDEVNSQPALFDAALSPTVSSE